MECLLNDETLENGVQRLALEVLNNSQKELFVEAKRIFVMNPDQHLAWLKTCWEVGEFNRDRFVQKDKVFMIN